MKEGTQSLNTDDNSDEAAFSVSTGKAVQLFTYLLELCALRTSHVRDVSQYDEVFWFGRMERDINSLLLPPACAAGTILRFLCRSSRASA